MPSTKSFANLFGITVSTEIDPRLIIVSSQIEHEKREKRRYFFNIIIKLKFVGEINDSDDVLSSFLNFLKKTGGQNGRIMHTGYGTPYECAMGSISVKSIKGNEVVLESLGKCNRRYDLPNKRK